MFTWIDKSERCFCFLRREPVATCVISLQNHNGKSTAITIDCMTRGDHSRGINTKRPAVRWSSAVYKCLPWYL